MKLAHWCSFGLVLLLFGRRVGCAPIAIHAFDIYPNEYLDVFKIVYDEELSKQFLQLYHKDGAVPNKFYADARYEFPEVEKRIRGLIAYVPQRARRLTPAARNFLELISKHVEVVLIGSESNIKQHITNILNTWNRLSPSDKKSYGEQFPDSSIILDSDRYQQLIQRNAK